MPKRPGLATFEQFVVVGQRWLLDLVSGRAAGSGAKHWRRSSRSGSVPWSSNSSRWKARAASQERSRSNANTPTVQRQAVR